MTTAIVHQDVERAEIREWFKDHRATFNAHLAEPLGVQALEWAKPDSWHCAIRYVIQGSTLMVWGDLELLNEGRRALADGAWEWQGWMHGNAHDAFGPDWYEWVPDFGKRISMTCHAHLIGIKMAIAQRGATS